MENMRPPAGHGNQTACRQPRDHHQHGDTTDETKPPAQDGLRTTCHPDREDRHRSKRQDGGGQPPAERYESGCQSQANRVPTEYGTVENKKTESKGRSVAAEEQTPVTQEKDETADDRDSTDRVLCYRRSIIHRAVFDPRSIYDTASSAGRHNFLSARTFLQTVLWGTRRYHAMDRVG